MFFDTHIQVFFHKIVNILFPLAGTENVCHYTPTSTEQGQWFSSSSGCQTSMVSCGNFLYLIY